MFCLDQVIHDENRNIYNMFWFVFHFLNNVITIAKKGEGSSSLDIGHIYHHY